MYLDGLATCGKCIKRIRAYRSPRPADPTLDWPVEDRGDRCLDWITRNAELALLEMPEADRSEWIRVDEWRRKQSLAKQIGEHARHWSFAHLIR